MTGFVANLYRGFRDLTIFKMRFGLWSTIVPEVWRRDCIVCEVCDCAFRDFTVDDTARYQFFILWVGHTFWVNLHAMVAPHQAAS